MPATWVEISQKIGAAGAPRSAAGPAIEGGAYYMSTLRAFWRTAATPNDQHWLAQASYNAGAGNVRKAVRLCDERAPTWPAAAECLDDVTGKHSVETLGYVQRIGSIWLQLDAGK